MERLITRLFCLMSFLIIGYVACATSRNIVEGVHVYRRLKCLDILKEVNQFNPNDPNFVYAADRYVKCDNAAKSYRWFEKLLTLSDSN